MATPGEQDLDPSVLAYDAGIVPWLFEPWAAPMVDLLDPEPGSCVIDVACGSGLIVRHVLDRLGESGRVHGVDVDRAALDYAAQTIEDPRVAWHESDAARLPFATGSMDRASCHQGLQFVADRPEALREIRRVLVPGGRLVVATWGRLDDNPWPRSLSAAVGSLFGSEAGAGMAVVCDLGEPAAVADLMLGAGFVDIVVREQTRTATHHDVRTAAAAQLAALPSGSDIHGLSMGQGLSLIHISEPTRHICLSRMPSSA